MIPETTHFVGGFHDTCSDSFTFFDREKMSEDHQQRLAQFVRSIDAARALNAKERCRRFALVDSGLTPEQALAEVERRSTALFEPRPELGHVTNNMCIVGRRALNQRLFLDRRAFLQSYDPSIDPEGEILAGILAAVIPVCGGINLEYYFSRVDNTVYGCGTKLPHNVCGMLGVMNGIDDDLRTGLPSQMIEIHDPIRLLTIVEQKPEVLKAVIAKSPALTEWVGNAWVKLVAIDPATGRAFQIDGSGGEPTPISVREVTLPRARDSLEVASIGIDNLPIHALRGARV